MKFWNLTMILVLVSIHLFGQPPLKFKNLTVEDGLSYSLVFEILKDSKGFMWFGTTDGLNKFDGHDFIVYQNVPGDSTSLADNSIWALFEDSNLNLWVGTDGGGLSLYDRQHDIFYNFKNDPSNPESLPHNSVNVICEDNKGNIWIGTYGGGISKLISPGKFENYKFSDQDPRSLSSDVVHTIFEDSSGRLWIGTRHGLNLYNPKTKDFTRFYADKNNSRTLNNDNILSIGQDGDGILWLGTWGGGLNAFSIEKGIFKDYGFDDLETNRVASVYVDSKGRIWAGFLEKGLVLFDKSSETLQSTINDHLDPSSLVNNNVWIIYEDNFNNIWLGTEGGISWINAKKKAFYSVDNTRLTPLFQNTMITDFDEDNIGNILFSTEQEVGILKNFSQNEHITDKILAVPDIWSILVSNRGGLWVSSYVSGLYQYQKVGENYELTQHLLQIGEIDIVNSTYLFNDGQGVVWLGTYDNGLFRYKPKTNSFRHFPLIDSSGHSPAILTMSEGTDNNLWIGTYGKGLIRMDKDKGTFHSYIKATGKQNSLGHNTILSIYQDKLGNVWIGTDGGGLNKLDLSADKVEIITTKEGLPSNVILGIIEDANQRLWLTTNNGISNYDKHGDFQNYDQSDGLISKGFNADAFYKDKNGKLFMGSGNGFNFFYPDSIQKDHHIPEVIFTDLKVINKSVSLSDGILNHHINVEKSIELSHEQNFFTLNFTALDYIAPVKNKYAYKLEGFNVDWVYTDASNRSATYTNLDHGDYIMHVKASNSDGIWGSSTTTLNIKILPPPWKTWWAYSLYALGFLMVLFATIRAFVIRERLKSNLKLERLELQKMQELDAIKSSFFAGISHEFRTPLTLILTPLQVLSKKYASDNVLKWNLQLIKRNANRLLNLINQLLDLSKIEAGKLKLQLRKENIVICLNIVSSSFETLATSKELKFIRNLPKGPIVMFFDKEKVEQILINLLSNAFKFTPKDGLIEFQVSLADEQLMIKVSNSGEGIPEHELNKIFDHFYQVNQNIAEGTGIGLALVREFAVLHHGRVEVKSQVGGITTFTVYLPVLDTVYKDDEIIEEDTSQVSKMIHEQVTNEHPNEKLPNESNEKLSLLIVEDNEDLSSYLSHHLSSQYSIFMAQNGKEGLQIAVTEMPDIIIIDMMMPEMDGIELIEALHNDFKTNHIPVLMLTAKMEKENRLKSLDKGADHYLNKPFDMEELKVRVRNLITQRKRIREHYHTEFITNPKAENILSVDDRFLKKAVNIIDGQLDNHEFTVDQYAGELAMSRIQLHRKMKAIIGCSTSEFMRHYRLKKAYEFLKKRKGSVSEIAYSVGFNNLSYFTRAFKELYKVSPSELLR